MKIYKPIGSKERFVEMFQNVNKVKLNESLIEAGGQLNPQAVLNMSFNELKNNRLKIQNSSTQSDGDVSYVELVCVDNQGNNVTFTFKAIVKEGDQEGVFSIEEVGIESFSFDSAGEEESVDLSGDTLKQFNAQHASELYDVVNKYVDVKSPEVEKTAELEEAIKLIDAIKQDSYPFGGGNDRMQTGQNYADEKPTNSQVRVKSPELDKFVQEDLNPVAPVPGKKLTTKEELNAYVKDKRAKTGKGFSREDAPLLAGEALYYIAVKIADSMLPMGWDGLADVNSMWDYIKKDGGMSYDQLKAAVKRAVNVRLKEEGYSLKDLGLGENKKKVLSKPIVGASTNLQELDKPAQKLIIPKAVYEAEDDDVMGQELNRFSQEIELQNPEEVGVDDEPVLEVSDEKKKQIYAAYDSLVEKNKNNPNYSPTTTEIMAELDRMAGVIKPQKTRTFPVEAEPYLEETPVTATDVQSVAQKYFQGLTPEQKEKYIIKAKDYLEMKFGADVYRVPKEKYYEMIAYVAGLLFTGRLTAMNEEEKKGKEKKEKKDKEADIYSPFKQLGKTFKPKSQTKYPKKKKKPQTSVKINEIEESTDRDKFEDVVFLQGDEAYEPLERLDREGPDAALEYLKQWHYPGEHQGSQEEKHGREDKVYRKDGYTMSWNPALEYIGLQYDMSKLNEPAMSEDNAEPETDDQISHQPMDAEKSDDGMSLEPKGDEIEQIAQDKEEVGELIPGGKGEGKSPLEFDPDQILKGMKVELEHTDDPMIALEITLDHLTEDPEYYTVKDTPEASAQAGASKDAAEGDENGEDKEMTDMLLGYKSMNVGDEIEEPEEEIPHTPETPEVPKDVQDSEEEIPEELPKKEDELGEDLGYSERDIKQRDPATWHQIQIAKKTLRMPGAMANVMGGMTKEEAKEILSKRGIKFSEK
jgi:hypothetical protein